MFSERNSTTSRRQVKGKDCNTLLWLLEEVLQMQSGGFARSPEN